MQRLQKLPDSDVFNSVAGDESNTLNESITLDDESGDNGDNNESSYNSVVIQLFYVNANKDH
jgi:hypothetical protein